MSEFLPPMPVPPGGDQNRAAVTYGASISIIILSTTAVAARMYARVYVVHNVGWDDHTIMITQLINLADFIFQILITKSGFGRHMYYLTLEQIVACGLYFHIIEVLYVMSTAVVKVSACLFLLRIMARGTSKLLRYFLHGLMAILMILCISCSLVIILQCMPVNSGWDPRVKGRCWKFNQILGIGYAQNAWAIVSDLVCAAFPLIILRNLQINTRSKYALYGIMGMGLLTAICCIVKIAHLADLTQGDITWNGVTVNLWGVLEQNIAVIACSVPALQPLFKAFNNRTQGSSNTKGAQSKSHPVLSSWKETTANKFSSRSRNFHSIKNNDTNSDSEEQILPSQHDAAAGLGSPTTDSSGGKGIRKTTDVELFYHEAGGVTGKRQSQLGKDKPIEMV